MIPRVGPAQPHVPIVRVERAGREESVHCGSIAVVEASGALLASAGAPDYQAFTRSALKPLQALPFFAAGGAARFGLSGEQVAVVCASHSGEAKHQAVVADLLRRAGCRVDELGCGAHAPRVYDLLDEAPPPPPYSPLAHNCSGKHAGMLAHCVLSGWPREGYLDPSHPLQAAIRASIARHAGVREEDLVPAIDGCSAPNYALPLASLALAFARLAHPDDGGPDAGARRTIADAMTAHPDYVSGERRFDLALMRAIKVGDGAGRALAPATIAVLEALGAVDERARRELAPWVAPTLHNARGTPVGALRSVVVLDKPTGYREAPAPAAGR